MNIVKQNHLKVWDFFLGEAKVRLVDAKSATERREWRTAIRSLEGLARRNVRLPKTAERQLNSRKRNAATRS
jgi:hypothetical protein